MEEKENHKNPKRGLDSWEYWYQGYKGIISCANMIKRYLTFYFVGSINPYP